MVKRKRVMAYTVWVEVEYDGYSDEELMNSSENSDWWKMRDFNADAAHKAMMDKVDFSQMTDYDYSDTVEDYEVDDG